DAPRRRVVERDDAGPVSPFAGGTESVEGERSVGVFPSETQPGDQRAGDGGRAFGSCRREHDGCFRSWTVHRSPPGETPQSRKRCAASEPAHRRGEGRAGREPIVVIQTGGAASPDGQE